MSLREILARRAAIATELRSIDADAEDATSRMDTLEAELRGLALRERQLALADDAARREPAREAAPPALPEGAAWGLRPEQRMADWHRATTGTDTDGLSLGRYLRGRITGRWDGAEAEQRTMGTTIDSSGGFFVPDPISANVIDLMRARSAVVSAGALTVPMAGANLRLVRVVSDPTPHFRGEGVAITESDGEFAAINLQAYSLAALVRINNELLDDVPSFAPTLDGMVAGALAAKLDWSCLYGSGAGMPLGPRGTSGAAEVSMGANGAALSDYDPFLTLMQTVMEANGMPDTVIMAPRTAIKAAKLVTGISSDKTKLVPPAEYAGLRKVVSSQVSLAETQGSSSVASSAFIGSFQHMAIAVRQGITIEASRVADDAFARNQTLLRAIVRYDVAVLRPAMFGRLVGIL
jgi:HK97 family phage major capsid protein